MKILIIGFTKLRFMPYMNFYLNSLGNTDCEVSIVSWSRDTGDIEPPDGVKHHEFSRELRDEQSKLSKIPAFLAYRRYLIKLLKKENYDFLIVLHTLPGVLIYKKLCSEYKKRFILDYRDYTYERYGLYKCIIGKLTRASVLTFVSSDRFRKYLPDSPDILTSHNLLTEDMKHRNISHCESENGRIRIAFWGYIRHGNVNTQLIGALGNDSRFELHYYGREQDTAEKLKEYCKTNNIGNVFFHGQYNPSDRYDFAQCTDIIHNLYDAGGTEELAVGNKYYDSLVFRIPQICSKGSYMGELAQKDGTGIMLDPSDSTFADRLQEYYNDIDRSAFNKACDIRLSEIIDEYNSGMEAVKAAVSKARKE